MQILQNCPYDFLKIKYGTVIFHPKVLLCVQWHQNHTTRRGFNTIRILEVEVRKICAVSDFLRYIQTLLRFTEEQAKVREQAVPFIPPCYIRTVDGISEVFCVLLRRRRRIEKSLAFVSGRCIRIS